LAKLLDARDRTGSLRGQLMRQAARVATNRTVAGVHFPVDSAAGRLLGTTLAEYLIGRCKGAGNTFRERRFNGSEFGRGTENADFQSNESLESSKAHVQVLRAHKAEPSDILKWLWRCAEGEWNGSARKSAGGR
jgi:hypothetical protein